MKLIFCTLVFLPVLLFGQVDEIKSSSKGGGRSERGSRHSSSGGFFFDLFFSNVVQWQAYKLNKRESVPAIVSLDVLLQAAAQPSSYYIVNPRIRGNWGLFSTDFRLNYILEEDIDGVKYLRTNDWQILQFNIVTTPVVNFRMGAGVIQESFELKNMYWEGTTAVTVRPLGRRFGFAAEFRNADARTEVNGQVLYSLFNRGALHGYVTGGATFQRYYKTVNVWGLQGGFAMSIY